MMVSEVNNYSAVNGAMSGAIDGDVKAITMVI